MSQNGTGVQYPEITLGGVTYTVKCTRAVLLFRLSRKGIAFTDLNDPKTRFAALFEIFHAMIGDQAQGKSVEDFVQIASDESKVQAVDIAVGQAIPKVFPSTQAPATPVEDKAPIQ
jgi:hypothetical protein